MGSGAGAGAGASTSVGQQGFMQMIAPKTEGAKDGSMQDLASAVQEDISRNRPPEQQPAPVGLQQIIQASGNNSQPYVDSGRMAQQPGRRGGFTF